MYFYKVDISQFNFQKKQPKIKKLSEKENNHLIDYERYLSARNYSKRTITNYKNHIQNYLKFVNNKNYPELNQTSVMAYFSKHYNYSPKTKNQLKAALLHFFKEILETDYNFLEKLKIIQAKTLPLILSPSEIIKIIQNTTKLKYKLIFMFAYSSGLRLSEILNLKYQNIDRENNTIIIKKGKGRKDRNVILAKAIIQHLIEYCQLNENKLLPTDLIFTNKQNKVLSNTIVQNNFQEARKKAKVQYCTIHTLRHCYATHSLESGVDIFDLQFLLGHQNIETTMVYLKTIKPKLGVDLLDFL